MTTRWPSALVTRLYESRRVGLRTSCTIAAASPQGVTVAPDRFTGRMADPICARCGGPIVGAGTSTTVGTKRYHPRCAPKPRPMTETEHRRD